MDAVSYFRNGYFHHRRDKYQEAINNYTRALDVHPQFFFAFYHRAMAKVALHDFLGSIADYTAALDIMPSDSNTLTARSVVWLKLGETKQAKLDEQSATSSNPTFFCDIGRGLLKVGDRNNALIAFDKGIAILEHIIEVDLQWRQLVQINNYFRPHQPETEYFWIFLYRGKFRDAEGDFVGAIRDYKRFTDAGLTWDRNIRDYASKELLEFMENNDSMKNIH